MTALGGGTSKFEVRESEETKNNKTSGKFSSGKRTNHRERGIINESVTKGNPIGIEVVCKVNNVTTETVSMQLVALKWRSQRCLALQERLEAHGDASWSYLDSVY